MDTDKILKFQYLELDHYIGKPYPGMPGAQTGPVPIIRMFGITEEGNSVCCHIHGFTSYFYVSLPDTFTEKDCAPFKVNDTYLIVEGNNKSFLHFAAQIK